MRKTINILFLITLVLVLITGNISAQDQTLKIANFYGETHPVNVALRDIFVPMVEAGTNNSIKVEIYSNNQLGGEREFTEGVRAGTIEMGITGGLLSASKPKLATLELPYLFRDYDHAWEVLDGPIGEEFEKEFEDAGIHVLAWLGNGLRVISNSKRPINELSDTEGIRLRVPENKIYIDTADSLGFNVVTMGMGEVFNALNQHVMDGQENPLATLWSSGWYEVQDYVAISHHIFSHAQISMNKQLWDSLSEDRQNIIEKASIATAKYQRFLLEDSDEEYKQMLIDEGLEITYPDKEEFREATKVVRDDFREEYSWAGDLIDRINEVE